MVNKVKYNNKTGRGVVKQVKLIEFSTQKGEILRGILVTNKASRKAVLMCGGFERAATTEKKFKALADKLIEVNIPSFRFDYLGCGLSDGDFSKITVRRMSKETRGAAEVLQSKTGNKDIAVVAYSLSACTVAELARESLFKRIVLIAPSLNQKDLFRYWFVVSEMKNRGTGIEVTWQSYQDYLDEDRCREYYSQPYIMTKMNRLSNRYFLENMTKDYSGLFVDTQDVLLVHGNRDDDVPFESLNFEFANKIIVKGGDHDLERPDMIKQWLGKAVDFIRN